jgi:hypothetical protein
MTSTTPFQFDSREIQVITLDTGEKLLADGVV